MKAFIGGITAGLFGWLVWLVTRKPAHRTEPTRPAFMYTYPERLNERSWRKWAKERRK